MLIRATELSYFIDRLYMHQFDVKKNVQSTIIIKKLKNYELILLMLFTFTHTTLNIEEYSS